METLSIIWFNSDIIPNANILDDSIEFVTSHTAPISNLDISSSINIANVQMFTTDKLVVEVNFGWLIFLASCQQWWKLMTKYSMKK